MRIVFQLLREGSVLPKRGTLSSGAFDIYAPESGEIVPGGRVSFFTGLAHQPIGHLDHHFKLQGVLFPRSGLAKLGLRLAFSPCLIDNDYRGEIIALLENVGQQTIHWSAGDRMLQIAYIPMFSGECFAALAKLSYTERGEGGFGSTGIRG